MTAGFWDTWGDRQAEVASYKLSMPGAPQPRNGTATVITAVEPMSKTLRVKANSTSHPKADVARAIRLSIIREYQTTVSRQNDMLTAFVWLEAVDSQPEGMPAKVSYSSQEPCGQIWSQLIFGPGSVRQMRHSYLDGEGDVQRNLTGPPNSISEDVLLLVARRMAWPRLMLGQTYQVQALTSLETERAQRAPLVWSNVALTLSRDRQTTTVPAGHFRTNLFTAKWPDKLEKRLEVEADPPYRVIRWTSSIGEKAELVESVRKTLC